jgi:hypothetical protein
MRSFDRYRLRRNSRRPLSGPTNVAIGVHWPYTIVADPNLPVTKS